MVREGKTAKVAACKDAEVKSPVPGHPQMPVKGRVIDGMAMAVKAKPSGDISYLPVQRAERVQKVASANVTSANQEYGKVFAAQIENVHPESRVKEGMPLPAEWKGVRGEAPRLLASNVPPVKEITSMSAESGLTLEQLFVDSKEH